MFSSDILIVRQVSATSKDQVLRSPLIHVHVFVNLETADASSSNDSSNEGPAISGGHQQCGPASSVPNAWSMAPVMWVLCDT